LLFRFRKPPQGVSLLETLLSAAIGLLVLGVVYQLLYMSRVASSTAQQSYLTGQDTASSFRALQRELTDTSLASIVVRQSAQQLPCLSFLSAQQEGGTRLGADGAPVWLKVVHYQLERRPGQTDVGTLIRYEQPLPATWTMPFPQPARLQPSGSGHEAILNVLLPGRDVRASPANRGRATVESDPAALGGFVVRFLRREPGEVLSDVNPAHQSDRQVPGWTRGSTGLVQVQLGLLERDGSTGQLGFVEFRLRIRPNFD
jgi:hypothetical protein